MEDRPMNYDPKPEKELPNSSDQIFNAPFEGNEFDK